MKTKMTKRCTKEIPDGCDNWKPGNNGLRCGWIDYCGICNLAELKKCEDCGGVPELKSSTGLIYYKVVCGCGKNKSARWCPSKETAVKQWNAHKKTPPTRGELEAEVERLKAEVVDAWTCCAQMSETVQTLYTIIDHDKKPLFSADNKRARMFVAKWKKNQKGKPK
jgi:hypothetical protein